METRAPASPEGPKFKNSKKCLEKKPLDNKRKVKFTIHVCFIFYRVWAHFVRYCVAVTRDHSPPSEGMGAMWVPAGPTRVMLQVGSKISRRGGPQGGLSERGLRSDPPSLVFFREVLRGVSEGGARSHNFRSFLSLSLSLSRWSFR